MALRQAVGLALVGASVALAAQSPAPERWRLVEVWRSGGAPDMALTFGQVSDLELAPNGHLLVLTRGHAPQLAWVDNTGRPIRSIGRTSTAPPLLDAPNGLVQFPDGRIVVNDPREGRFVVLTEDGRYVREVAYQPWGWTAQWLGFVAPDGSLLDPIPDQQQFTWRRWAPDFAASQMLPASACDFGLVRAGPEASFRIEGATGGVMVAVPFLQPAIALVRTRDGSTWSGVGPDFRRIVHTTWGSCEDGVSIELTGTPIAIPTDIREAEQRRLRQLAVDVHAPVMPDIDRIPTVMPLFHALRVDRQGRLWVERHVRPTMRAFSVFMPDGRHRAEVASLPVTIDTDKPVTFSDNHLFGFTTDDAGWTWLVAMRIERVG